MGSGRRLTLFSRTTLLHVPPFSPILWLRGLWYYRPPGFLGASYVFVLPTGGSLFWGAGFFVICVCSHKCLTIRVTKLCTLYFFVRPFVLSVYTCFCMYLIHCDVLCTLCLPLSLCTLYLPLSLCPFFVLMYLTTLYVMCFCVLLHKVSPHIPSCVPSIYTTLPSVVFLSHDV